MNIALGALIITILLLPGAVILKAYYTSFSSKDKELHIPFAELLFRGLAFSFLVHLAAIWLMNCAAIDVDYKLLYQITIADKFDLDNERFTTSFLQFGLYNLLLTIILHFGTKLTKKIILDRNLDLRFHGLRSANFWYLIFSARYLEFKRTGARDLTDLIWVDVMVSRDMVYSGFIIDFEYSSSKDELETITLTNASKRTYRKLENLQVISKGVSSQSLAPLTHHPLKLDTPRQIQGDAFVILAKDILNINLYYVELGDMDDIS
jgi:hypothetical protein